jgi:hypothetical protein
MGCQKVACDVDQIAMGAFMQNLGNTTNLDTMIQVLIGNCRLDLAAAFAPKALLWGPYRSLGFDVCGHC